MTTPETQEQFEARIFAHYDCSDAIGDWEILVYVMLLKDNPDLLSPKEKRSAGRPTQWTPERELWLFETVERVRADSTSPPEVRAHPTKAIKHIHRAGWFLGKLGRHLAPGTLSNAYARGKAIAESRKHASELPWPTKISNQL